VSVPFTANQDLSGAAEVVLTLPPITVALNQAVKLDAFANVNFMNIQGYSVNGSIARNLDDPVTDSSDTILQGQSIFEQVNVTTPITWVDSPEPGTYNYTYTITGFASIGFTAASIDSRGFTATVIAVNG
jgi:hypothetical protein